MNNEDKLAMYEAQAIAVEKQLEINQLKREKEELAEKLRRLELGSSITSDVKLDDVWKAINNLKDEVQKKNDIQKQATTEINKLQQNVQKISSKVDVIQTAVTKHAKRLSSLEEQKQPVLPPNNPKGTNTILVLGGADCHQMAILDRKTSKWIELQLKLPHKIDDGGVVCLNDEIYIIGGFEKPKRLHKLSKNFKWTPLSNMTVARRCMANACLVFDGCIWVFGGYALETNEYFKTVERYDPQENKWTKMPDMTCSRADAAATAWNGKIIVCGGHTDCHLVLKSAECYDPQSGVWTPLGDIYGRLYDHFLIHYDDTMVLMGGKTDEDTSNREMKTCSLEGKGTWTTLGQMMDPVIGYSVTVLGKDIYIIGGRGSHPRLDEVLIFNGKSWQDGPVLPYHCAYPSSVLIPQHLANLLCSYKYNKALEC